jgi:hypothetical protein
LSSNLGTTSVDDEDLIQVVMNGEDDANEDWSIDESYSELPNCFDLRQEFLEYLLSILREKYRVISIENNFECPDKRTLLYVSNPVNLMNTTVTLSESKYYRIIDVLEEELEWTESY